MKLVWLIRGWLKPFLTERNFVFFWYSAVWTEVVVLHIGSEVISLATAGPLTRLSAPTSEPETVRCTLCAVH